MPEVKKVVYSVLLPSLQLSLGLFLIMKTTPLWAVIHCSIAYLLDCCYFPFSDYKQLRGFNGRVFKKVISHTTAAGDVSKVKKHKDATNPRKMNAGSEMGRSVPVKYLDQEFVLERMDGDKMQVKTVSKPLKHGGDISMKDGPAYYITDKMWETMKYIGKVAKDSVFVKNHKEIWEEVVTGDIMEFEEVLDAVILGNRAVVRLDHDYFLPVNLLLSEDKLRATLNFVGIFLQTQKQVHWVIPACLSITAAVMGFCTTLRVTVAEWIGKILRRGVQFVCDHLLPYKTRRSVYCWCSWVEGFKPSNDFQAKIIKGDVRVLVAGGAKFHSISKFERIVIPDCLPLQVDELCTAGGPFLFRCGDLNRGSVYIEWIFDGSKCSLRAGRLASDETSSSLEAGQTPILCGDGDRSTENVIHYLKEKDSSTGNDTHSVSVDIDCNKGKESSMADGRSHTTPLVDIGKVKESLMADNIHTASVDIDCSREEAIELFIFAYYTAELKSGSLRSFERKSGTVYVRHFVESINAYVRSGYPPLHKSDILKKVVVR